MTWLALTLLAFGGAVVVAWRWRSPLTNPTLLATLVVSAALLVLRVPYEDYLRDVQPLQTALAPAIVALAVPLYRLRALLARQWRALVLAGGLGTLAAVGVNGLLARALPVGEQAERALLTAPATSPVALQLAPLTGAPPALAATLAVLAGLLGALLLPGWLRLLGVRHPLARGVAVGCVAHGVGTARAREEGEDTGAAASVGMGLAALVVTLAVAVGTTLAR